MYSFMKTSSFKFVYATATLVALTNFIVKLALTAYVIYEGKFLTIEYQLMLRRILTVGNVTKFLLFWSILVSLLGAYSLNIKKKFMMRISSNLTVIVIVLTISSCLYFRSRYPTSFNSIVEHSFYQDPAVQDAVIAWNSSLNTGETKKDGVIEGMQTFCRNVVAFETTSAVLLILLCILLWVARSIKLEEKEPLEHPPITELSRVGLNTTSLRTKRVVLGTA